MSLALVLAHPAWAEGHGDAWRSLQDMEFRFERPDVPSRVGWSIRQLVALDDAPFVGPVMKWRVVTFRAKDTPELFEGGAVWQSWSVSAEDLVPDVTVTTIPAAIGVPEHFAVELRCQEANCFMVTEYSLVTEGLHPDDLAVELFADLPEIGTETQFAILFNDRAEAERARAAFEVLATWGNRSESLLPPLGE